MTVDEYDEIRECIEALEKYTTRLKVASVVLVNAVRTDREVTEQLDSVAKALEKALVKVITSGRR